MNKGTVFAFGLLAGAGLGGFVANKILQQNYEQKLDEEITSVRNALLKDIKERHDKKETEKADKQAATDAMKKYGAEKAEEVLSKTSTPDEKKPYPVPPDIVEAEDNPYRIVPLKMYSDGAIYTKEDVRLSASELNQLIGENTLQQFGDEDDRICIRNERLGVDYEILKLPYTYSDATRYGQL